MVLFEFALGKGVTAAGFGIVKAASMKSGASAALFAPSVPTVAPHDGGFVAAPAALPGVLSSSVAPSLWNKLAWFGEELSGACGHLKGALQSVEVALQGHSSISTVAVSIGTGLGTAGILRYMGVVDDEYEKEEAEPSKGIVSMVPKAITICAVSDMFMGALVFNSLNTHLSIPLRTWALGGIALSFPMSGIISGIVANRGLREGVVAETAASALSFVWLSWGTMMLSSPASAAAAVSSPLLWWSCFAQCVLVWSCIATMFAMMVMTTAISVALGTKM